MGLKFQYCVYAALAAYLIVSLIIFNKVYKTSEVIVDELFHIPQGMRFCQFNFTYWDPKITTLPGLYIISTILLGPPMLCTTYWLRIVNVVFSLFNFVLILKMLRTEDLNNAYDKRVILQALNLVILPPLFFFSFVYYTDCISITFVLLFLLSAKFERYWSMTFYGLISILVRQTNVVWIVGFMGCRVADVFYLSYVENVHTFKKTNNKKFIKNRSYQPIKNYALTDIYRAIDYHTKSRFKYVFRYRNPPEIKDICYSLFAIIPFWIFAIYNGSLVVGDKDAHVATVHIPQLFYFSLFYGFFAILPIISNIKSTIKKIIDAKFFCLIIIILFLYIIQSNTLVHRYLLSDNRHYTFYVWNRFYGKFSFAKYIMVPAYLVFLTSMISEINKSQSFGFFAFFFFVCGATMCLQKMIEVRYFLLPFIILRIKCSLSEWWVIAAETVFYIFINVLYFRNFFTKEIYWEDFEDVQRLIW